MFFFFFASAFLIHFSLCPLLLCFVILPFHFLRLLSLRLQPFSHSETPCGTLEMTTTLLLFLRLRVQQVIQL
ncbi:hypothetical protein C8R44DRAFT_774227 [Mycena epipterygia]|nr:hypothetical protein C8R44DRAFT_774227 [Mycena epipterygia]